MAGQKFQYDESGSTFLYFLISFVGLVLVPCTFYFGPSDSTASKDPEDKDACSCGGCRIKVIRLKKPERWKGMKKNFQRFLLALGWCFLAFLVYKVQDFDYEYANFDPYDILGVGMQASSAEIKKAYRKLSLVYHPDKTTGDEKKFMKLNKAYQALTDDTARRNYELYGNPDGPGAMNFGIALPSWIIEKENSLLVLGVYAMIFMFCMPTVVAMWWYRSSKFSNDQILIDTTQLYYYFISKTPQMMFKRSLIILAASMEYESGHNSKIQERPSDNLEVPALIRHLPMNISDKNKERPFCMPYSLKARALFYAHMMRMPLNEQTLDIDRLYVIKLAPALINEMVNCFAQMTLLAHGGKISRMPSIESVEGIMKMSPHIVQAVSEGKPTILQLPYITEENLRSLQCKKKPIRSINHFVSLTYPERRNSLRHLGDEEFDNVLKVCHAFPSLELEIHCEVVDDDDSGVFTAGAIVTVTVILIRTPLDDMIHNTEARSKMKDRVLLDEPVEEAKEKPPPKETGWKPKVKLQKKKKPSSSRSKSDAPKSNPNKATSEKPKNKDETTKKSGVKKEKRNCIEDLPNRSGSDSSFSHSDESEAEDADSESHKGDKDDDDIEWERCQRGLTKKEKVLEGKSKLSHRVHCPYFTEEKQEYWWVYMCDRKKHQLITAPYQVTNLETEEEVQLKLTAPMKPGMYTYQVCVRSDSYIGCDVVKDLKLDVKEAREIPTAHPQWEESSSDEEEEEDNDVNDSDVEGAEVRGAESEYASDSDFAYDSD